MIFRHVKKYLRLSKKSINFKPLLYIIENVIKLKCDYWWIVCIEKNLVFVKFKEYAYDTIVIIKITLVYHSIQYFHFQENNKWQK